MSLVGFIGFVTMTWASLPDKHTSSPTPPGGEVCPQLCLFCWPPHTGQDRPAPPGGGKHCAGGNTGASSVDADRAESCSVCLGQWC